MPYCPNCGVNLRENSSFCSKCGKSVDSSNLLNKDDPSLTISKDKQSGIGLQLVLLIVVGLCLFAFVVWVSPVFLKSNQGDSMKGLLNPSSNNVGTKGSLPSQQSTVDEELNYCPNLGNGQLAIEGALSELLLIANFINI